jgi:hypothetical protein
MPKSKPFRFGNDDHGDRPLDALFLNGTNLDDAIAELTGEESPEAEAARTARRWSQEATSSEWTVRHKPPGR